MSIACRELNLVSHDLNAWGKDFSEGSQDLADLLPALNQVDGLEWIRCFYLYPAGMTDRMIDAMASSSKVLPYIDMQLLALLWTQ